MTYLKSSIIGLLSLALSAPVFAQQFVSSSTQATLIELYTSQGCSSCPPAEEYLNSLKNHPQLWKSLIPIALHVDYWDYLGWKDRFASPVHTQRQRAYARVNAQRTIYTPAFFVNGKPWRRGFFNAAPEASTQQVGILQVAIEDQHISAKFTSHSQTSSKGPLNLHVALLAMELMTNIQAGENQGRASAHEFVSFKHVETSTADRRWKIELPRITPLPSKRYALVAWVSPINDPRPIQAVGGYLEKGL
jgi:hypothetical protein